MNLQQLRYFLTAADLGSFSAAAEELHLAQPSVSEQVRRLEAELGVRLFQRVGRGLVLTDAGRALRPRAESVLDAVGEARDSVLAVRELRGGTASFGTFGAAFEYLGGGIVAEFRRRHPKVRLRVLGLNSAEAADDVRAGRLEAAIVQLPVDDEGLAVRPVLEDELMFVSRDAAALASPMTIERLARRTLVLTDASYGLEDPARWRLAELAQGAGVTIAPAVDLDVEPAALLQLAADGVGDTVFLRGLLSSPSSRLPAALGWVPFRPSLRFTIAFIFREGTPLSPAAREMTSIIEDRIGEVRAMFAATPRQRLPG